MTCSLSVHYSRSARALLALILFTLAGCDSGPKVYPVRGAVVHLGKGHVRDLAGYNLQFQSVTDAGEMPAGRIEEDGTFILYTRVGGKVVPGVKQGTYRACFLPPVLEGGGSPPLVIPLRYTKFETSKLQYDISPGENNLKIEIERGPR